MNYAERLPETLRKGVSPEAPLSMRLMLASGHLPLSFSDKLCVLGALENDPSDEVRFAVENGWMSFDSAFLEKSLSDRSLPAELLDLVAAHTNDYRVQLVILAHQNVGGQTIERFVESGNAEILDRISGNQRVLVDRHDLIKKILANPALESSVAGRLYSLLGEDVPQPQEETASFLAEIGFDGELPENFSQEIPDELLNDVEEQEVNLAAINESMNIYKIIQGLSIAEKIKLATMGSKSARKLLSKDSNRVVVNAVIRSPKIREDEVVPLAQDRTTSDDVLVYIVNRKEWMKNYQIKLALCKNPKTPLPKSLRILESLAERDLRALSKDKNIPNVVSSSALRILTRKTSHH